LGRAAEMREMSVDLPAFGEPARPASAGNFSSNCNRFSSAGVAKSWSVSPVASS
jgi:hypothetical protein